jgi:predicted outer membrane repeat protein
VGSITFANNTGIKGGAMALYSSTLNIARDTSVYFYNNTAIEVGGAIYVASEDSNYYSVESTLNYLYMSCFYQLLDFNEHQTYNMRFVDNSATKGGDNIILYGEVMHGGTCYVAEIGFSVWPTTVSTYCVQNLYVHLPKSISSVSSDPTRICMCVNDQPQCHIQSYDIAVHPGEAFKLPAVIVGADLGTTVGPVYALVDSPREAVALKPASQYIQEI